MPQSQFHAMALRVHLKTDIDKNKATLRPSIGNQNQKYIQMLFN